MNKKLHFETKATKLIDSGTFANMTLAKEWIKNSLANMAKCYENDGAEIFYANHGESFVTGGGDQVEGSADWFNENTNSPVYAEIRSLDI